ncbi:unnamed protein product [Brachionus calyciflorus]|uniref:Neural proliferation differentiation and control protein 1 n=1 Tax=Brachionus calyciflorus TaxID=104777 RepID=A0A813MJ94_9BILA|nr:unnamed protein product [Brachionus calyciflorus]
MFFVTNKTIETCSGFITNVDIRCDYLFFVIIAAFVFASLILLLAAGVCWYTSYRKPKRINFEDFDSKTRIFNPSFSIKSTSSSGSNGDRRLAQSAQMYHYQHQKQQMIAMEKASDDKKLEKSENSDGEHDDSEYTIYECPGLANTGEMVVKNPLFSGTDETNAESLKTTTQSLTVPLE